MNAPVPPINANSDVEIEDSCNCHCCISFGKRSPKRVRQDKKVEEIDVKVRRQQVSMNLGDLAK